MIGTTSRRPPAPLRIGHPGLTSGTHRGMALPVVLVLLLVLAFVGLFAARRSGTEEEISNNARVNQVAWLAAQSGLRYCEAVVIDWVDEGHRFDASIGQRVQTTALNGPEDPKAKWGQLANWADGSTNLITVNTNPTANPNLPGVPALHCIAEALPAGQYLITARGLSAGASFNTNGLLQGGAEVWLQSIITPGTPVRSTQGGYE